MYRHTYIIGYYIPLVRIISLVSHTTFVVCVNFIHKWQGLQFKVDSELQIFWETFHGKFLFTLRVFARNWLRGNHRTNTCCILFWCLIWGSRPGFTSNNKPTNYLLDYGDFKCTKLDWYFDGCHFTHFKVASLRSSRNCFGGYFVIFQFLGASLAILAALSNELYLATP